MEIIGHQKQWQFLKKAADLGRLPHALLFVGPSQVGKRTLALALAQYLNCQSQKDSEKPCRTCSACQAIARQTSPDLIFISPSKKEISIEQIRELSWKMSLRPYESPWKVAILDEIHTLGKEAQNSFLKTLEEPKQNSLFILITPLPARLLPTILSRVQKIRFFRVSSLEIAEYLKKKGVQKEKAKRMIGLCAGRPGLVVDFLKDPSKLKAYEEKIQEMEKILGEALNLRFQYAENLSEKSLSELNLSFEIWLNHFHHLLLERIGEDFSQTWQIKRALEALEKTQILINFTNVNRKLALENLFLQLER